MAIKLAVFDMAGTTIADKNAVSDAFKNAFLSKNLIISEEMVNPLMGYKKPVAIKMVLDKLGADASAGNITDIHDLFVSAMMEHYQFSPNVKALPGAEEAMWKMKKEGVIITLNTGFSKNITDIIIDRMKWMDRGLIDDYIASDEVPLGRPDPAMIHKLMSRAGISDPREVIKIGDTEVDINEGRNANCLFVVSVTTGAFSRQQLEPYKPDYILDNLSELPELMRQHA
jgi:phosphonatase-like hydrolase